MNMRSKEESHPKCQYCDKAFKQRERGGGQLRKYCSDDCKKLAARERARKHHYKNRNSFRHFTCEVCEKKVTVPTGRDQKTKYCSDECEKVRRAERRKTKTESDVLPQV